MSILEWNTSSEDLNLIHQIADRVLSELKSYKEPKMHLLLDLEACHGNGCPLDLKGLLAASPADLSHDMHGILQNINRVTGKLENCFVPRYVLKNQVPAGEASK